LKGKKNELRKFKRKNKTKTKSSPKVKVKAKRMNGILKTSQKKTIKSTWKTWRKSFKIPGKTSKTGETSCT
jgi:hypothetical protein